jgi:hypothetical protein
MINKQPEPTYLISESKLKRLEQHGYDFKLAKEMRSNPYHPAPEPSSEPSWIIVGDGSDRDWRLISMYELRKLEHAINEECVGKNDGCPPGHLKEMHDSGNEVINKCRTRSYHPAPDIGLPFVSFKIGKPSFTCTTERKLAINDITSDSDGFSRLNISIQTGDLICIYRGEDVISEQDIRQSEREKAIEILQELKGYMEGWKRANLDLNDVEKGENVVLDTYIPFLDRKIESLRRKVE